MGIIAPQGAISVGRVTDEGPNDVRVEFFLVGRVVLFDELVRGTPAVDFFKIENLACHWTV